MIFIDADKQYTNHMTKVMKSARAASRYLYRLRNQTVTNQLIKGMGNSLYAAGSVQNPRWSASLSNAHLMPAILFFRLKILNDENTE